MRRYNEKLVFSATDLVNFLGCRHATFLDRHQLDHSMPVAEDDAYLDLLQEKGLEHERAYRDSLKAQCKRVIEIADEGSLEDRSARTHDAMTSGADVIYQGAFLSGRWHGFADFLIKTPGQSNLGSFHYEPLDTKLSHSAKPKHVLQLGVYAELLAQVQGRVPERLHVLLGTGESVTLPMRDFRYYLSAARQRFEAFVDGLPQESVGEPCQACSQCRWRERCEEAWEAANHLSLVARITGAQIEKLNAAGINKVTQLSALAPEAKITGIQAGVLQRLRSQASLQEHKRTTGENRHEVLPPEAGRGFERLPRPSAGDLFFDMEGDPLIAGGLEYLFGFAYQDTGTPAFKPFWGHTPAAEKKAFEDAMDFISGRLKDFPNAHIYHYAAYEETAIKRLAMLHGTRETEVDNLLRAGKLVDLYRVVREAIRVSEPSYSIKNLEVFYRPPRDGAVSSASESVVKYEQWRKLGLPELLKEIEEYNKTDCVSTLELRDWLLTLRSSETLWHGDRPSDPEEEQRTAERIAEEQRAAATARHLLEAPPAEKPFRELVGHLLEFHKREAKPGWWFQFTCAEMTTEGLVDDAECIGDLRLDESCPPFREKQSTVYTFEFPAQDFKMRIGDSPRRAEPERRPAGTIFSLDEKTRRIQLKCGRSIAAFGEHFSLIPDQPMKFGVLRDAIYRYADSILSAQNRYAAITALLRKELPRIQGIPRGAPVVAVGRDPVSEAIRAISGLDSSCLLVQGPPGAGKTYLSAHAIVALLKNGKRVAIAANSHKAVNRLLQEVAELATAERVPLSAVKKCSEDDHECDAPGVTNVHDNDEVTSQYKLVAGTAWLFGRPEHDQAFDHLFVDEAGQVSLGHLVAMGVCARNIVLVGDQMQLGQPIQGTHPGESGLSALEFLLKDYATIPPERGVFLDVTRRMHPDVCRFISEAVYEGRLHSDPACAARVLTLGQNADPALKASGVAWLPVDHQDCRQRSPEEATRIQSLFASLLGQRWVEQSGSEGRPLTVNDILVVSPYNMQVNLLRSMLPDSARVGTVDKFQGQEAAVVIVSMTASSAEDIPRGMEFLYSRNRLNVAISRAKSLAIVVASPLLLEAPCSRVEQLTLVNTLCFAKAYADGAG